MRQLKLNITTGKKLTRGRPVDHFTTSVAQESNSGLSYLKQIQLGVRPGNQVFLPIPRGQAGKSRSSACLTESGREIGASCHSHGVMPGNEAPLPVTRFLLQILHRPRLTELGIFHFTPETHANSCMLSKSIAVMKCIKILHIRHQKPMIYQRADSQRRLGNILANCLKVNATVRFKC